MRYLVDADADADSPQEQSTDTNPIPHRADDHVLHLLLVRLVVHVASSDRAILGAVGSKWLTTTADGSSWCGSRILHRGRESPLPLYICRVCEQLATNQRPSHTNPRQGGLWDVCGNWNFDLVRCMPLMIEA